MNLFAYSIHDAATSSHMTPFFLQTDAAAERVFGRMVNDETHQFSVAPKDYSLYLIGIWDDDTAELLPIDRKLIINGSQKIEQI